MTCTDSHTDAHKIDRKRRAARRGQRTGKGAAEDEGSVGEMLPWSPCLPMLIRILEKYDNSLDHRNDLENL